MLKLRTLQMISTGDKIGRYRIRSAIGKGGMGEVFLIRTGIGIGTAVARYRRNFAEEYTYAGQNDRALEQIRKVYDLEPNLPLASYFLGLVYINNGMYAEAIALSEKDIQTDPSDQGMLRIAGYAYAKFGRQRQAEEVIKRFKDLAGTQYVSSYYVASIYIALGDKEKAFVELEKAFVERDWDLHRLKADPLMRPLRDDARYQELLRRIGLPQ